MSSSGGLFTPRDFVQAGWDWMRNLGQSYVLLSQQVIGDLTNLEIVPIQFDDTFELTVDYGSFVRPTAPVVEDLGTVDVSLPTLPTVQPVNIPAMPDAPEEPDFGNLQYSPPSAPDLAFPTAPNDVEVVLDTVTLPTAPDFTLPDLPTLYELDLPDVPELTIPEFDAARPDIDLDPYRPDASFNWQEVAYSSDLLDAMRERLTTMLSGGLGLPAHVEQAIFDRGRARADGEALKLVQQVADTLATRGLDRGGSYINSQLDEARMKGRQEIAGLNRDVTIRAAEIEVESVRAALAQAGALEATLIQANSQLNQRALEAAKIAKDVQVAVFNAYVSGLALDVELFKADAAVYRDRIEAERAKAELYRAQIEGQKAIGEVNESLVRAYAEQVKTVNAMADIYRAQVEAARVSGEINTQRLEQARLRIQVFGTQVEAFGKAQEAYKIGTEAALGNVRFFEAIGNVYGQRVQAYKTLGESYFNQGQLQIRQQELTFTAFNSALELAKVGITEQAAAVDAKARTYAARAAVYQAEGQVVAAEAASNDRNAQLRIAAATARSEVAQKVIDARIAQNGQIYGLYVEQLKAKAQVVSQLAAATLSGVNFGASYGGSLGVNTSYGVGFNFSGDTVSDLNPPYLPIVNF